MHDHRTCQNHEQALPHPGGFGNQLLEQASDEGARQQSQRHHDEQHVARPSSASDEVDQQCYPRPIGQEKREEIAPPQQVDHRRQAEDEDQRLVDQQQLEVIVPGMAANSRRESRKPGREQVYGILQARKTKQKARGKQGKQNGEQCAAISQHSLLPASCPPGLENHLPVLAGAQKPVDQSQHQYKANHNEEESVSSCPCGQGQGQGDCHQVEMPGLPLLKMVEQTNGYGQGAGRHDDLAPQVAGEEENRGGDRQETRGRQSTHPSQMSPQEVRPDRQQRSAEGRHQPGQEVTGPEHGKEKHIGGEEKRADLPHRWTLR